MIYICRAIISKQNKLYVIYKFYRENSKRKNSEKKSREYHNGATPNTQPGPIRNIENGDRGLNRPHMTEACGTGRNY